MDNKSEITQQEERETGDYTYPLQLKNINTLTYCIMEIGYIFFLIIFYNIIIIKLYDIIFIKI
jgi:hypothetical protein